MFTLEGPQTRTYWSFKVDTYNGAALFTSLPRYHSYWFLDYWGSKNDFSNGAQQLFFLIFVLQILTLGFGASSIYFKRKVVLAAPIILTIASIASMTASLNLLYGIFQLGYYLVFPALVLFIIAFSLNITEG